MRAVSVFFGVAAVCLCLSLEVFSQGVQVSSDYLIDNWTTEDGLPVNFISDIHQGSDGYLWLATFDGLVRFDGVEFTHYQKEKFPGLPSNRINRILEDNDGTLYLTTEQFALVEFRDQTFRQITKNDGLSGELVRLAQFGPDYKIWLSTNEGFFTLSNGTYEAIAPELISGNHVEFKIAPDTSLWYIKSKSEPINYYKNGDTFSFSREEYELHWLNKKASVSRKNALVGIKNGIPFNIIENVGLNDIIHDYLKSTKYGEFVCTDFEGCFEIVDSQWRFIEGTKQNYSLIDVPNLYEDEQTFILATNHVMFVNGKKVLELEDHIVNYFIDREQNIWISTRSSGLYRLKKNSFTLYGIPEGAAAQNVISIYEDDYGNKLFGLLSDQFFILTNTGSVLNFDVYYHVLGEIILYHRLLDQPLNFTEVFSNNDYSPGQYQSLLLNNKTQSFYTTYLHSFLINSDNTFLAGAPGGLYTGTLNNNSIHPNPVLKEYYARAMVSAPDGSIWMATNGGGIVQYSNGEMHFFDTEQGLHSDFIRSLHISENEAADNYVLWIGSEDKGLARLEVVDNEPNFTTITTYGTKDGLLDYAVHSILEDSFGYYWMNTNRGIFRISKTELDAFHTGEIAEIKGRGFTEKDGLRNREGNGGNQFSSLVDRDGRFWFANQAGAVSFDPGDFIDDAETINNRTIIESITLASGESVFNTTQLISLSKDERNFEIKFTHLNLSSPENIKFRYRLSGFDEAWTYAGNRRTASFTNIPKGDYRFEVSATDNNGEWISRAASVSISIAPTFTETVWFYLICSIALGLGVYVIIAYRIKALQLREKELSKLVKERTKELELERQRTQEQADQLKDLDRAKTRFFTNISHELRTPLTLIMSPLTQLMNSESYQFSGEVEETFQRMFRNSERLLRLIDQTLELTKLEQGKLRLALKRVELEEFLIEITELFEFVAEQKNITLKTEIPDTQTELILDPDKLDKIVANLLSNAIKFTPAGGEITLAIKHENDSVQISVSDTGIGITPENLSRIFGRFYQVDSGDTRIQEGSGIGLSLAKDLAELHHGSLKAESEPGSGTTFTLVLKLGTDHYTEDELCSLHQYEALTENDFSDSEFIDVPTPSIMVTDQEEELPVLMIVEDNEDLRSFIKSIFAKEFDIEEAFNGTSALEAIEHKTPDLIIADIMMPEMDGLEFNRRLKSDITTASIPLIFLTAKASKQDILTGLKENGDDYITKPFDPQILKARAKNLLNSRLRLRDVLLQNQSQQSNNAEVTKESEISGERDAFLSEINKMLSVNYMDSSFSVKKLSELLYVDRSQLFRKLKENCGLTPSEYIRTYRMEKAVELYKNGEGSISEIAYATGFKSLSYFSYSFKEHYKCSPSEYFESISNKVEK